MEEPRTETEQAFQAGSNVPQNVAQRAAALARVYELILSWPLESNEATSGPEHHLASANQNDSAQRVDLMERPL